jgi:hypothetical protein
VQEGQIVLVAAEIGLEEQAREDYSNKQKAPFPGPFSVAGAGFEPATSGL